jgi:predicted esterase
MSKAKILFLHGKESNCQGRKVRYLEDLQKYDVCCEPYNTGGEGADGRAFVLGCVETTKRAIQKHNPDLLIGSSFGGAVLLKLLQTGAWKKPCIMLAGAGCLYGMEPVLPEDIPVILIHGTEDTLIPLDDSVQLTRSSALAKLIVIQDIHPLHYLVEKTNILETSIDELLC